MHDSTLESMASAIEQAQCILMVVTEKYRLSVNCQAEAKYAFRLQKTIIPIILQSGYHNIDGWLGFIISDKDNFTCVSDQSGAYKLANKGGQIRSHGHHSVFQVLVQLIAILRDLQNLFFLKTKLMSKVFS